MIRTSRSRVLLVGLLLLLVIGVGAAGAIWGVDRIRDRESPSDAIVATDAAAEAARVERLAGLGRLWGALQLFHPAVATQAIDWDAELVRVIPRVSAADSADAYRAAIDDLLSSLNDPATRVVDRAATASQTPSRSAVLPQPFMRWTDDRVAVIVATDYDQMAAVSEQSIDRLMRGTPAAGTDRLEGTRAAFESALSEASSASAVVLDLRRTDGSEHATIDDPAATAIKSLLQDAVGSLLVADAPMATERHVAYWGYPPQAGPQSPYTSRFVISSETLTARGGDAAQPPLVILVNAGSAPLYPIVSGLQAAGRAVVLHDGPPGVGGETVSMEMSDDLTVILRVGELVNLDGSRGLVPDMTIAPSTTLGTDTAMETALRILRGNETPRARTPGTPAPSLISRRDQGYGAMRPPALEYRLLALFRFWNAIEYFFPYKDLIGRPWDAVLREYIPKLEAADDEARYVQTLAGLVSTIEDTHGRIGGGLVETHLPRSTPPIVVTFIEGETVVTAVLDEALQQSGGLQIGDVVRSVDGEGIEARRGRIGSLVAASTPQARQWRIHLQLLAGESGSDVDIEVERAGGTTHTATVRRTAGPAIPRPSDPVYRVLPEGYGYIDLERLTRGEVDAALEAVRGAPALIIDIRGYPQGAAFTLAPRLTDRTVTNARFRIPELHGPHPSQQRLTRFDQHVQPSLEWRYTGKVVVLINEEAISQSEHSCLLFEAATDVTFIGTPTSGANGNITSALLPGGISAIFTGLEVRHGDGRQLQRVGVLPDVHVAPTIDGVRAGRDEVLEAAVRFLQEQGTRR